MIGHRFLSAVTALTVLSCGDSTGPDSDVTVTVTVTRTEGPSVFEPAPGELQVECVVRLQAVAIGSEPATWQEAKLLFYAGSDRSSAVDSTVVPASEIRQSWGADEIQPNTSRQSAWRFTASIPFGAAFVYRYEPESGGAKSARVAFNCGPDIPADPQPPTITGLSVQPSGEVEPTDTVTVHYVATSSVGLLATSVEVSGACSVRQTFVERFVQSVEHTVSLVLPRACTLGDSILVSVEATNSAVQRTVVEGPRRIAVVDRTPPHVFTERWPTASNYFFTGDTLQPFVAVSDNNAVRALVWEVQPGGVRDSIVGEVGGRFLAIPIRPEWAGTSIQVRLFARDASGLVSDTVIAPAGGIPIYPTVARPTRWASFPGSVQDLVIDEVRDVLYITQFCPGGCIAVFSMSGLSVIETISLPTFAWDLDLSASGDSLILALSDRKAIGIIDLRQPSRTVTVLPLHTLDTTTQVPARVRVGANGKAYVITDGPGTRLPGLLEVDLGTGAERVLTGAGEMVNVVFERSGDGNALLLKRGTSLQRYDVATDVFSPVRTTSSFYGAPRVDQTGSLFTVGLDVYNGDLEFQRRVAAVYGGEAAPGIVLTPDGLNMYHSLGNRGVGHTRTSDGTVLDRSLTPVPASGYLRVSPSGNTLVVMDSFVGTTKIALVDLR